MDFNTPDNGNEENQSDLTPEEMLAEVVGEDKKYKTIEDAIKSIVPAQEHINTLETELATLRDDLTKSKTQEELLEEMRLELLKAQAVEPQAPQEPEAEQTEPEKNKPKDDSLEGVDINALIEAKLREAEAQKNKGVNVNSVTEAAIKAWGSDAETKFYEAAANNGYSKEMIKALATTSPQAALHAVGLKANKPFTGTSPAGTLRTASPEFNKMEEPSPPKNWGNDLEVAEYMEQLQKYEDSKEK